MRFAAGTRTSSSTTCAVGEPLIPSLCSSLAICTPQSCSTTKALMPRCPAGRIGLGEHGVEVRDAAVGDPHLRAGQHVVVTVAHRPHGHRGDVRPGVGLGQAVAALALAGHDAGQVAGLELVGREVEDRQHGQLRDEEDAGWPTRPRGPAPRPRWPGSPGPRPLRRTPRDRRGRSAPSIAAPRRPATSTRRVRSVSAASGASLSSANWRTTARNSCCSGVSVIGCMPPVWSRSALAHTSRSAPPKARASAVRPLGAVLVRRTHL